MGAAKLFLTSGLVFSALKAAPIFLNAAAWSIKPAAVLTMEVPCCTGLLHTVKKAMAASKRKVPVKHVVIGIQGDIQSEDWVSA